MKRIADTTLFTDDYIVLPGGRRVTAQEGGVNEMDFQRIIDRKIPTYWSAGLCDSTAVRRMEALFPRLNHEESFHRLLVGPWGHGGRRGCGEEGTWACGDDDGFRDMIRFVRMSAKALKRPMYPKPRSSRLTYIEGGVGWAERPLALKRRRAVQLSFGDRLIPTTPEPDLSAMSPKHLISIPKGLWWDVREHYGRRDWSGVGHDVSEIALVLGSRFNQILSSLQTLVKIMWRQLLQTSEGRLSTAASLPPDSNMTWVDLTVTSDFATTGSLSRWSIVQHLMRMPLDTSHVLRCSQKLRRLIQWGRLLFNARAAPSVLELWSAPLTRTVIAEGIPRLQIPFLILRRDLKAMAEAHLDWAVVAVLQSDNKYLSEGRALISFAARSAVQLQNVTRDLPTALREGSPMLAQIDNHNLNRREDFKPVSELFRDDDVEGVVIFLRFQLESVSTKIQRGSRLHLTLLPEDYTNFPWRRTAHKMLIYGADPAFGYSSVHQAQTWRIPIAVNASRNLGWLLLPLTSDDL